MPVNIISKLEIKNNPTNAVINASQVTGGYIPFANTAARNALDITVRVEGLLARTNNDGNFWILNAGPWNNTDSDWTLYSTVVPDATTSVKGIVQLAGDIGGTATSVSVLKLRGANLDTTIGTPSITQDGYVIYWDNTSNSYKLSSVTSKVTDATTSTKGIIQLAGDIGGSATSVSVLKLRGKNLDTTIGTVSISQDGYAITWDNTNLVWKPTSIMSHVTDATTSNKGIVQLAGDLAGTGTTAASPKVSSITGTSNIANVLSDNLAFPVANVSNLYKTVAGTGVSSSNFVIKGQSTDDTVAGNLNLEAGDSNSNTGGDVNLTAGIGSTYGKINLTATSSDVNIMSSILNIDSTSINLTTASEQATIIGYPNGTGIAVSGVSGLFLVAPVINNTDNVLNGDFGFFHLSYLKGGDLIQGNNSRAGSAVSIAGDNNSRYDSLSNTQGFGGNAVLQAGITTTNEYGGNAIVSGGLNKSFINSGANANITTFSAGTMTLTGLSGMTVGSVGNYLTVTGAANSVNNGVFVITNYISATSVEVSNPGGTATGLPNTGIISWTENDPTIYAINNGVVQLGVGYNYFGTEQGAAYQWQYGPTVEVSLNKHKTLKGINNTITFPTANPYTIIAKDYLVAINTSGGARTVDLPATPVSGDRYLIKDDSGNAGANNITINATGGYDIEGDASKTISSNYSAMELIFNGTNWRTVGSGGGGTSYGVKNLVLTYVDNTASPYTILPTDYMIVGDCRTGNITINLPASPAIGDSYVVKDGYGGIFNTGTTITIASTSTNIEGYRYDIGLASTQLGVDTITFANDFESVTLVWNGTLWNLI